VKNLWAHPWFRSRYLLALAGGILWACSFPRVGIAGFAWVAPGVLLSAALGKKGWETFRVGYVGGLTHYLISLYWLLCIPYRWHGIPVGPAAGLLALGAFLALFPATWVWLMTPRNSRAVAQPPDADAPPATMNLSPLAETWLSRTLWALWGAAVWVGLEMFLARIFGGFPWDLLGVSQVQLLPLIQIASVTGVYGLSFLAVWFSLSLIAAATVLWRRPGARSIWLLEIALPILTVAVLFNLGLRRLTHETPPGRAVKVTMIQPSIPQTVIWDATAGDARFHDLLRLSAQALSNRTDVLVWPEGAVPRALRYDTNCAVAIMNLAQAYKVWMIVGSDDAEPRPGAKTINEADYFNGCFLISPQGEIAERYVKRNLVIFGEYIPFEHSLPFMKYLTPVPGSYTPGTKAVPFELSDLSARLSVLICFEDTFPHLARADGGAGTDFLVNITNDGWFDDSAAQWQHAFTAVFRAVENGLPLARCSNNGLTCLIDARGRMKEVFRDQHGSVYGPGFLTVEIPVGSRGTEEARTFYNRHGDWCGWTCVALSIARLVCRNWPRRRAQS